MIFDTLKDKCEYYRSLCDDRLMPNSYAIVMLDGRSFSKNIKNRFKLPFDDDFVDMMNKTAAYVCSKVSGAKLAYVQSDEISILLYDDGSKDCFFGYRKCKLLSIIASIATSYFNRLNTLRLLDTPCNTEDMMGVINDEPLYEFDCKVWNVPNLNDAYAWFLYRQNDCIRNSKQQFCQTYLSHKELVGLHTDEQVVKTLEKTGNDWTMCRDDLRFGRFIMQEQVEKEVEIKGETIVVQRNVWMPSTAFVLNQEGAYETFCLIL